MKHTNKLLASIPALLLSASLANARQNEPKPAQPKPAAPSASAAAIPPDNEHAAAALKNSPRHGEWVDIDVPAPQITKPDPNAPKAVRLHTWIVYPERKDKAPVVLVIHEIFGETDWVRGVADQLAADGFIAVAPDLLSGMGPDGGGTESLGNSATDAIRKLSSDETNRRLDAALGYALQLPSASGKCACVGFCWGGSASFAYAVHQPKLNAAVVYYGTAPAGKDNQPDKQALANIKCPVLGLYGGDDARVTATVEPTAKAMEELKKSYSHHVFEGAGHGFLRQSDPSQRNGANRKAAEQAWSETIALFNKSMQ